MCNARCPLTPRVEPLSATIQEESEQRASRAKAIFQRQGVWLELRQAQIINLQRGTCFQTLLELTQVGKSETKPLNPKP